MSIVMVEIGIHYSFIFVFETDIYLCPNKFYILSLVPGKFVEWNSVLLLRYSS